MRRVEGTCNGIIDVKRFGLPGVTIIDECPNCKAKVEDDLGDRYLTYPPAGKWFTYGLYCQECEHEWEFEIKLDITLSVKE